MKPGVQPGKAAKAPVLIIVIVALVGAFVVFIGLGAALLLPAVSASRAAAQRMQCSNNLKMIALAMHNYHDTYKAFPPAYTVDANGNKLHSWRTILLPYLEQQALYEQIDLSKPWDDPVNKHFSEVVLDVYCSPAEPRGKTPMTSYMAIVGDGTIFEGSKQNRFADVTDGTSNTLLVVGVRDQPVSWMEPTDLELDKMKFTVNGGPTEIGSYHPAGANVAFADGSVRFLAEAMDPNLLKNIITRNDGNAVRIP